MERKAAASASTTKHRLISDVLSGEIQEGKFKIGDLLPSEPDLSERFGVSRHTVRAALRSLHDLGLVTSRRGVGTAVQGTRLMARYSHGFGSADDLFQYATSTRVRLLEHDEVVVTAPMAAQFQCKAGERWWRIRTVRQEPSNNAVVAYSEIHLPLAYGSVIRHAKKSRQPFFSLIETLFHEKITDIQQEISCVARLPAAEAAHLQLPKASPGLQITRRYVGSAGHTLEFARSVHPAELFKYAMRLQLRHGA
jgi:GntR family transcriptional regulator